MKVYGSNAIRNVAFVGHGASGKTSLVDALAFVSGASRRHGSIKDGTTLTDYSPDEIERKHSINLGLGYAEWLDTKINLIDTPGYLDYFGEVVTGSTPPMPPSSCSAGPEGWRWEPRRSGKSATSCTCPGSSSSR